MVIAVVHKNVINRYFLESFTGGIFFDGSGERLGLCISESVSEIWNDPSWFYLEITVCVVLTFLVSYFPNIIPSIVPIVEDTPLSIFSIDDDKSVS